MKKHPALRLLLYIVDWGTIFTLMMLVVVFALTGDLLPVPEESRALTGDGFVDTYGMRPVLLALFLGAVAADAALFVFQRFPGVYRYPFRITAANIEAQYHLAKIMFGIVVIVCNLYACALFVLVYKMRIHLGDASFQRLTWYAVLSAAADVGIYFLLAWKYRGGDMYGRS